jgi:hypothetical protein
MQFEDVDEDVVGQGFVSGVSGSSSRGSIGVEMSAMRLDDLPEYADALGMVYPDGRNEAGDGTHTLGVLPRVGSAGTMVLKGGGTRRKPNTR